MYSGEIVELGQIKYIFDKGEFHHPYTIGLFNSIPNIKEESARLNPIEGMMPDPTLQIQGCRFADRVCILHKYLQAGEAANCMSKWTYGALP